LNKTKVIIIVCWIISALALVGLAVWFLAGPVFGAAWNPIFDGFGQSTAQGTHSISTDGLDSVYIDWTSGRVTIELHDGDHIQITEFSSRTLGDNERLSYSTSGGTLQIDFVAGRGPRRMPSKQLEVLIPRALSGSLNDLTVGTVSGRITIDDLSLGTLYAHTVSGRIELSRVTAETLRTNTTSGRHDISGTFDEVSARSVSGRIEFTSSAVPTSLVASTTSGRIAVTVPNQGPIGVQQSTVSGRFESDIPVVLGGDDVQFHLSTVSGRINIYALALSG